MSFSARRVRSSAFSEVLLSRQSKQWKVKEQLVNTVLNLSTLGVKKKRGSSVATISSLLQKRVQIRGLNFQHHREPAWLRELSDDCIS